MSENENQPDPVDGEKPEDAVEPNEQDGDKWKHFARKNEADLKAERARNAELAEKAKKFDEWQESQKTADQKRDEELEQLRAANQKLTVESLRATVAAEKKVDPDYFEFLTGSTREELEAKADKLLALKGKTPNTPGTDGQGNVGDPISGNKELTPNDLLRAARK